MADQSRSRHGTRWEEREAQRPARAGGAGSTLDGEQPGPGGESRAPQKPSVWEWVTAAAGALLVLGAIGFMGYEAVTSRQDEIPRISVSLDTIAPYGAGYLVGIIAANQGGETAASVLIEGELRSDTGAVEKSETTIDYVPAHSRRKGGLLFTKDPRRFQLELRPLGYDRP